MNNQVVNLVKLKGKLSNITLISKESSNKIFSATLEVKRENGVFDYIPVRLGESFFSLLPQSDSFVEIKGSFKSYRKNQNLILYVWVNSLKPLYYEEYENHISLKGCVCTKQKIRQTPLSNKEILDFILKVREDSFHYYFFPIIAWNSAASSISNFPFGTYISIYGRIQSRNYLKTYADNTSEEKTVYEISTFYFSKI